MGSMVVVEPSEEEHSKRTDREAVKAALVEEFERSPEGQRLIREETGYLRHLRRSVPTVRNFRRDIAAWGKSRKRECESR